MDQTDLVLPEPGWFPDPYAQARFRWWNGRAWTHHVDNTEASKPRLPAWLSWPVIGAGVFTALITVILAVASPVSILLGLVPLAIVAPALVWLDRVEPEPWPDRIHALLWGLTVAALVALIINTVVSALTTDDIATVVSAPLVEEIAKAAGIYWAIRRRALDGVMDGVVYAGWVALGFAIMEDFFYFATAEDLGTLWQTFIIRALLTPFAHPLFTAWTGLAMGLAVSRKKKVFPYALWGLAIAIGSHAAWNGSLTLAESSGEEWVVLVTAGLFVLLFIGAITTLVRIRKAQAARFFELLPLLAERYGISPAELAMFSDWRNTLRSRKRLPRDQRDRFDRLHRALARLALFHNHPGEVDAVTQKRLEAQLVEARS